MQCAEKIDSNAYQLSGEVMHWLTSPASVDAEIVEDWTCAGLRRAYPNSFICYYGRVIHTMCLPSSSEVLTTTALQDYRVHFACDSVCQLAKTLKRLFK